MSARFSRPRLGRYGAFSTALLVALASGALDELPREEAARRLMERCNDKFGGT